MSVVGIDFGNHSCRIAVAHKGIVEVITNEVSNRRTPSMVAFAGQKRDIGESAATKLLSNYSNTVDNIKRVIGKRWSQPEFQRDLQTCHYKCVEQEGDQIAIEVQYKDEVIRMTPVQIAGSLFGCLKKITEQYLTLTVNDCVIAVPASFTDVQRRAIWDAANLAGLNVLRLMHETTAVGLQYGILRNLPEAAPIKVLFVDMGHSSTNLAVISFQQGKLSVLGTSADNNLGGRDFDQVLLRRFLDQIAAKHKSLDVSKNTKALLRLTSTAERAKKTLSANYEAPWNVECLLNDIDVGGMVTRDEFESLSVSLLERILVPIKQLLHDLNISSPTEIHSVEIVGGGVRVPAVKNAIENWFGRPVSTTCDSDESVARGAALQCAIISPIFKVRDFEVQDVVPYPIELQYGGLEGPLQDKTVLFPKFNQMPSVKMISFYRRDQIKMVAQYCDPVPGALPQIGTFVISGEPLGTDTEHPIKTKVRVKIDLNGVLSVTSATAIEDVSSEEDVVMSGDSQPSAGLAEADAPSTDEQSPASMDVDSASAAPVEAPKLKKKVKRTDLTVSSQFFGGTPPDVFQSAFEIEVRMVLDDRIVQETSMKRNDLETYVYDMRDKLSSEMSEFATESEKNKLMAALEEDEAWLYSDEGEQSQKSTYVAHLDELKKMGDPILMRQYEADNRDAAVENLRQLINGYREVAAGTDVKYEHIDVSKKTLVSSKCSEVELWLSELMSSQDRLNKYDTPVATVSVLEAKAKELNAICDPIMRTPKPKPAPKPAPVKEEPVDVPMGEPANGDANMREEISDANEMETEAVSPKMQEDLAAGGEQMNVD